jgi:hypothetical protein
MNDDRKEDRQKIVEGIISEYLSKESEESGCSERNAAKRTRIGRFLFYFRIAGSLTIMALLCFLIFSMGFVRGFSVGKEYWAIGKTGKLDAKTEECLGRMWHVRRAVDAYYAENKAYPDVVEMLYGNGFSGKDAVCPSGKKKYVFRKRGDRAVFECPDPGKHGLSAIWCDVKGGPPVIEKK